jgi:hypothetical protein
MDRKSTRPREDELTIPNSVNEDNQDTWKLDKLECLFYGVNHFLTPFFQSNLYDKNDPSETQ